MKRTSILLLFMLQICCLNAQSAADSSCYAFIKGTGYVFANDIKLIFPVFKAPYLLVNNFDRYIPDSVEYFETPNGYFRNNSATMLYGQDFVRRMESGNIMIYKKCMYADCSETSSYYRGQQLNYYMKYFYYSMSNQDTLRRLEYKNMFVDLAASKASMNRLKKSKNTRRVSRACLLIGSGLFVAGTQLYFTTRSSPEKQLYAASTVVGGILFIVTFHLNGVKDEYKMQALRVYNTGH